MATATGLRWGAIGASALHVCVDMQVMFSRGYPWALDWFERTMPQVEALCAVAPAQTVFTRFIPAARPGEGQGMWARYYERWAEVTLQEAPPEAVELAPALRAFTPPARLVDKHVYSPWPEGGLDRLLAATPTDTLIISGGETDICVLATVIGAIDRGYRVILAADAVCSFDDRSHDAMLAMFGRRFSAQLELCPVAEIIRHWRPG